LPAIQLLERNDRDSAHRGFFYHPRTLYAGNLPVQFSPERGCFLYMPAQCPHTGQDRRRITLENRVVTVQNGLDAEGRQLPDATGIISVPFAKGPLRPCFNFTRYKLALEHDLRCGWNRQVSGYPFGDFDRFFLPSPCPIIFREPPGNVEVRSRVQDRSLSAANSHRAGQPLGPVFSRDNIAVVTLR